MKKILQKTLSASILLLLVTIANAHDPKEKLDETRTARVTMDAPLDANVYVKGNDTQITFETWNEPSIDVTAMVTFKGDENEDIIKFLDDFQSIVEKKIDKSGNSFRISTVLDQPNKAEWGTKIFNLVTISYSKKELEITYRIKLPENTELEVETSYEDLVLNGNYKNQLIIKQNSADLIAGSIDKAEIQMKYGDISIQKLGEARLDFYEVQGEINYAVNLDMQTKYSDIEMEDVGSIKIESYETKLDIEQVRELRGELKYGEIEIGQKAEVLILEAIYEIDIEGKTAQSIEIKESKYSSVKFDDVGNLRMFESYEDEIDISRLGAFNSTAKYLELKIDVLYGDLNISDSYEADIKINEYKHPVRKVRMDGKYMKLEIPQTGPGGLSVEVQGKYINLNYDLNEFKRTVYIKDGADLNAKLLSKVAKEPLLIQVTGYDIKLDLD